MNGESQGELLRLNNGHPSRKNIAEKNYTAKNTIYQHKKKPNQK